MLAKVEQMIAAKSWQDRAQWVAEQVAECSAAHDAGDSFVSEGYDLLKTAGFFKALVPVEFGGGGVSMTTLAECIRIIGRSCGSTALAFAMHSHIVAVARWRLEHQTAPMEGLLKRVAAEDLVLNRRPDATERMLELAAEIAASGGGAGAAGAGGRDLGWRDRPVTERLRHALFAADMPLSRAILYFSRMRRESQRALLDLSYLHPLGIRQERRVPVAVIGGEEDGLFRPDAVRMTADWHDAQAAILPGLGHTMTLDCSWRRAADHLLEWLEQEARPGARGAIGSRRPTATHGRTRLPARR